MFVFRTILFMYVGLYQFEALNWKALTCVKRRKNVNATELVQCNLTYEVCCEDGCCLNNTTNTRNEEIEQSVTEESASRRITNEHPATAPKPYALFVGAAIFTCIVFYLIWKIVKDQICQKRQTIRHASGAGNVSAHLFVPSPPALRITLPPRDTPPPAYVNLTPPPDYNTAMSLPPLYTHVKPH